MKAYMTPESICMMLEKEDVIRTSGLAGLIDSSDSAKAGGKLDFLDILNRE